MASEGIGRAGWVHIGCWFVQQGAEVNEMLLHRSAFGAVIGLPFANEILRRHCASIGTARRAGPSPCQ